MTDPSPSYPTLAIALDAGYRSDDLKTLAALVSSARPTRKADRIDAILDAMKKNVKGIFDQLSTMAQHAVSETVHAWGGVFEMRMFAAKYADSPWPERKNSRGSSSGLLNLFLINGHIPRDLCEKLVDIVPKPPAYKTKYLNTLAEDDHFDEENFTVRETTGAALANLTTLLNLVADKKIRVAAKSKRPTAATVRNLGELLHDGDWYPADDGEYDPMQPFAWPLLIQGGKLARAEGSLLKLTPAGRNALKKDLAGGIRQIWERWEKTKIIDEFSRVTAVKGQKARRGRTMTTPIRRRPALNTLLKDLTPGKWIDLDELDRLMQSSAEYAFVMVNYSWKLYLLDQHYGHLDYYDTWPLLQFRYLLVYLFEYCATLGLIDVAYQPPEWARTDYHDCWGSDELPFLSHCDGLKYIRINELGAFVLGHTDTYEEKSESTALFEFEGTDLHLPAGAQVPPGQALYLEKIAARTEVDRWRLSVTSLLGAISDGENLADIKTALESLSSSGFTPEMEQLFLDVEHRATAFVDIGKTTLIQCTREFRKQALTHKKLNKFCLPAGDNYLVIRPGKEKQFTKAIESAGFIIGGKK